MEVRHDPLGRVFLRKFPTGEKRRYFYDGANVVEEFDENGTDRAVHVHAPGVDHVMASLRWGGKGYDQYLGAYYRLYDARNSVTHLVSDAGAVIESYRYDAFGQPWRYAADGSYLPMNSAQAASSYENRYLFTGREWFPEVGSGGLYDYRARLGRFVQTDPIGFNGGDANPYRYCSNDSVNGMDPTGLADPGVWVFGGYPGMRGEFQPLRAGELFLYTGGNSASDGNGSGGIRNVGPRTSSSPGGRRTDAEINSAPGAVVVRASDSDNLEDVGGTSAFMAITLGLRFNVGPIPTPVPGGAVLGRSAFSSYGGGPMGALMANVSALMQGTATQLRYLKDVSDRAVRYAFNQGQYRQVMTQFLRGQAVSIAGYAAGIPGFSAVAASPLLVGAAAVGGGVGYGVGQIPAGGNTNVSDWFVEFVPPFSSMLFLGRELGVLEPVF